MSTMKNKRNKRPYAHLHKTNPKLYNKLASQEYRERHPERFAAKDEWRKLNDYTYNELPSDVIPVSNFSTYYVRPNGEVWRDTRGLPSAVKTGKERVLKLRATYTPKNGYWIIQPYQDGKRKAIYLHRFILTAFKGPAPESNMECHHIDHDTSNNAILNLMWVTRQENVDFVPQHHREVPKKKLEEGRAISKSKHFHLYPDIIKLKKQGLKNVQVARTLGICPKNIHQMVVIALRRDSL